MWIIIYSCSFNRVKARHSALWYKKSSRRSSGSHPRRRRSARCPAFGSLQKRPSTPLACWLVAAAQHLAPRGWAPAVPIATSAAAAGRPCVPPPTPGLLRAASRPHEDRDPTRQQLDVRAGGRRWSPRGKGCPGRVGAPRAGPLLLSAGAGHRGSGRLNHSGRRWVGGVPGATAALPWIRRGGSWAGCAGHRAELGSARSRRADSRGQEGPAVGSPLTSLLPPGQPGLALSVSSW